MGTKLNPGTYDCYDKADPDEPMFVLLGRDASASILVDLWAAMRAIKDSDDDPKVKEARACAEAMRRWERDRAAKLAASFKCLHPEHEVFNYCPNPPLGKSGC